MAVCVRITNPDESLATSSAVRPDRLTIGSDASCDLVVSGPDVAAHHATVAEMMGSGRYRVEPLGPCSLGGARLQQATVFHPGQELEIGRWRIVLEPYEPDFLFDTPVADETRGGMPVLAWGVDAGAPRQLLVRLPANAGAGLFWSFHGVYAETRDLLQARLDAHAALRAPNVLPLIGFDLDASEGGWWTPFVPGLSLRYLAQLLRGKSRLLAPGAFLPLVSQFASAILALRGDAVLSDMRLVPGCMRIGWDGRQHVAPNHSYCSPSAPPIHSAWFAPEQIDAAGLGQSDRGHGSAASSVFTLGLLLRFALTDAHPHGRGPGPAQVRPAHAIALGRHERIAPTASVLPELDRSIAALVDACLDNEPASRPTLGELASRGGAREELVTLLDKVAGGEKRAQLAFGSQVNEVDAS
jgi:hypothetical protein